MITRLLALLMMAAALSAQVPNQPSATSGSERDPPAQNVEDRQRPAAANALGTPEAPVVVQVLPTPKTPREAAAEAQQRQDESAANWWMVRLTGAIILLTIVQLIINGLQTRRLKQTIEKMDEVARGQADDMRASIDQATRSAGAMERVAGSLNASVNQMKGAIDISARMAETQESALKVGQRAWMMLESVEFQPARYFGATPDDDIRIPIELTFRNAGQAPARITGFLIETGFGALSDLETDWQFQGAPEAEDYPVAAGCTYERQRWWPTSQEQIASFDGKQLVFVVGYITYTDVLNPGVARTTRFGRLYNPVRKVVRPIRLPNYNTTD